MYKEYPDYKFTESENDFIIEKKKKKVDKNKNLEENNINNSEIIVLDNNQ